MKTESEQKKKKIDAVAHQQLHILTNNIISNRVLSTHTPTVTGAEVKMNQFQTTVMSLL